MGAAQQKPDTSHQLPALGCKIIQILNPELEQKMQPFTDYIISPSIQIIRAAQQSIEVSIFSILDYSVRKELLPITDKHIGVRIKQSKIRDCILRISKTFSNSPCEKLGISSDEYIVGLAEAEYQNLQGFAETLKKLIGKRQQVITMAICNQSGQTRLVPIPLIVLDEWRVHNKGILGCELAEGWMNRFKSKSKKRDQGQSHQISNQPINGEAEKDKQINKDEVLKNEMIEKMNELKQQENQQYKESDQIERKCSEMMGQDSNIIEVNFKGLFKNEYLDDASTICKCKIYDKHCQKCFVDKQNSFYFFNKKTNRIINIPAALLFKVQD